jgi:hypothetical protein
MSDGPVTVATFDWAADAQLARCRLESSGIRTHMPDAYMGGLYWHAVKGLGGLRLQVDPGDAEDARAILDEPAGQPGEPVLAEDEQTSDRVVRSAIFGAVSYFVFPYALWLFLGEIFFRHRRGAMERRNLMLASLLVVPLALIHLAAGLFWLYRR